MSELDFENPHYCPVYDKVIDIDLCYETLMCLNRSFKISSVKELNDECVLIINYIINYIKYIIYIVSSTFYWIYSDI